MRAGLVALLAFVAGMLTMLAVHRHVPQPPAPAVQAAATAPSPADAQAALPPDDWPEQAPTPEQVLYAQPSLMDAALAHLGARVPGKPNLYLIAFAGDGSEDVFHNEAEYAARLLTTRFGPTVHALVLENHPDTLASRPLASWSNLETALDGVAHAMDPAQDILLLYLTTHGSEDHNLLVDMDPLPLDQIGAHDLAGILQARPFKWKVLVINACYSGGFVPPLQGKGTLVLTAARSDRSSFGCGNDSAATYFGRAWLADALNRTDDFVQAFRLASAEVAQWEKQDHLLASEPQIAVGAGIEAKLAQWRHGVQLGPAVPFAPASSGSTAPPR